MMYSTTIRPTASKDEHAWLCDYMASELHGDTRSTTETGHAHSSVLATLFVWP